MGVPFITEAVYVNLTYFGSVTGKAEVAPKTGHFRIGDDTSETDVNVAEPGTKC